MLKKLKSNKGFTIIEVLIVLAIAALILLIVFLAVPALQRNSRNTQRKNDVAGLLGAVSEFVTNNNGTMPDGATPWTNTGGVVTVKATATSTNSEAKVGYYNTGIGAANGNVDKVAARTTTAAGTLTSSTTDYVIISTGTDCNGSASVVGAARSVTAVYEIESGANTFSQVCQSS